MSFHKLILENRQGSERGFHNAIAKNQEQGDANFQRALRRHCVMRDRLWKKIFGGKHED
jgi:hypothetical protein